VSIGVAKTVPEVRQRLSQIRAGQRTIGLVPTMGALHAAHAALIQRARAESDFVVVSIFVNPLQFGPNEDYLRYPRPLDKDLIICERMGADLVFVPSVEELYAKAQEVFVDAAHLGNHLCGAFRPGHFRGVTTVVAKLFNIVQPERAYFGEKDYQQLTMIQRMVSDLNFPIEIVPVPTLREPDGLAMSSRNAYLSAEERALAPILLRALQASSSAIEEAWEIRASDAKAPALRLLQSDPRIRLEYLEIVDPAELQPVTEISGEVRIAAAIWIGKTRLIDNLAARPGGQH
jgi:pantoate--beta-alanine ligase